MHSVADNIMIKQLIILWILLVVIFPNAFGLSGEEYLTVLAKRKDVYKIPRYHRELPIIQTYKCENKRKKIFKIIT